jgi:hypothetical protein
VSESTTATGGQIGLVVFRKVPTTRSTFSPAERASISRACRCLAREGLISIAGGLTVETFRGFINPLGRQALDELDHARADLPRHTADRLRREVAP